MRRAFTLIELLVVVAIIALLMSLLMPALRGARDQAKMVRCLSNLRQIGGAQAIYFSEERDWFPFNRHDNEAATQMHAVFFGGHPGRRVPGTTREWWGYAELYNRNKPNERPFNRVLYPDLPDWDVQPDDPLYDIVRHLPVYECPGDQGMDGWSNVPDIAGFSSRYRYVGTSYVSNYLFVRYWAYDYFKPPTGRTPAWLSRANAYLREQINRDPSRFMIITEDPFLRSQFTYTPLRGVHRNFQPFVNLGSRGVGPGFARHNMLFLDGHAANMLADTSQGTWGRGWKSAGGNRKDDPRAWWNNPLDPDYRFREITPLPRR